ncbi:hypothetical protein AB0K87_37060, partial [Streptomyces sp. NPDC053705]
GVPGVSLVNGNAVLVADVRPHWVDRQVARGGSKGGDTAASSGATAGDDTEASTGGGSGKDEGDGAQDGGKEGQGQGEGEASSEPSPSKETGEPSPDPDALPAGYKKVTDERFHFTMAMPEGFKRNAIAGSNSGGIYNESGGFPRVQVDYNSSPGEDAAAAWRGLMGAVAGSSNGYKHIGIKKVEYNGYPTVADWEFTRNQQGKRIQVLNRGFKADATHGYSIMISCEADAWDGEECRTLRETAFATFEPKD